MRSTFDHEKLTVYRKSLAFIRWSNSILEKTPRGISVRSQLDRASTSIPLNIAEGNGKFTSADRCRYFDIARGSALECSACLDVLVARDELVESEIEAGKEILLQIVSMLIGLIRANSERICEEPEEEYGGSSPLDA